MTGRVAFVVPYLRSRGGWQTAALGAIRALARHVEPVLIVSRADLPIARELLPGFETHAIGEIQPLSAGPWPVARAVTAGALGVRHLPPLNVDLVHALEAFPTGWVARALARREHVPFGLTAHGTYAVIWARWPLTMRLYSHVLREAAFVCPISHGTLERMRARFEAAMSGRLCEVVLEGTDITERVPRAELMARRVPEIPTLISVGNLKSRKGYHLSLRAFARVRQSLPEARYQIVGGGLGGHYHQHLQALIEREAIGGVEFTGSVGEAGLADLYRSSSAFALLSQEQPFAFEGFGLVFLEAGAYGLPVIGTRSGGIPDAVHNGETGLLVEPEDIEGAAVAMRRVLSDHDLARRMGAAGRTLAESLTWDRYAGQQFAIYQRITAMTRGRITT